MARSVASSAASRAFQARVAGSGPPARQPFNVQSGKWVRRFQRESIAREVARNRKFGKTSSTGVISGRM